MKHNVGKNCETNEKSDHQGTTKQSWLIKIVMDCETGHSSAIIAEQINLTESGTYLNTGSQLLLHS